MKTVETATVDATWGIVKTDGSRLTTISVTLIVIDGDSDTALTLHIVTTSMIHDLDAVTTRRPDDLMTVDDQKTSLTLTTSEASENPSICIWETLILNLMTTQ